MASELKAFIVKDFCSCFENQCLFLLGDAYRAINMSRKIDINWDEENISANIVDHIEHNVKAIEWNIYIADECRQYTEEILANKKKAKNSSRIDLKMTTNWNRERIRYYAEAKNLIECDTTKSCRKTKISARKWHKRYVETGIDHYLDGHYPSNGCLLGYVLQGDPCKIAQLINVQLNDKSRAGESLVEAEFLVEGIKSTYTSCHSINKSDLTIKHLFLKFG